MKEPILISINNADVLEIMNEAIENEHDMFILNFKEYNLNEIIKKIKDISEILIHEKKESFIIFKNIKDEIIDSEEFITLYDYSFILNVKLFKLN